MCNLLYKLAHNKCLLTDSYQTFLLGNSEYDEKFLRRSLASALVEVEKFFKKLTVSYVQARNLQFQMTAGRWWMQM